MKKMLTLLVAVIMMITMATPSFAASFADTEGTNYEIAVEVLSSLGIVEGKAEGTYEPDSFLTRAEMATIILRAMNMAAGATGRDIFTDVPASHWAYANIAAAYQLGIINGTSETTFEPDKTVTYEQAVKMVVAALGYTVQAEAMGGYPSGYLSKASQLDLLKGVTVGGEMTRGNMAILVYNALDVELFLQTSFGDDAYEFKTDEAKTLLSYYLKVDHVVETVKATYAASAVTPAPKLLSDEVRIGDVTMKMGETDAQNMLGMRADVYTRKDEITEKPMIVAIVPRASIETVDLVTKDIKGLDGQVLSYEDAEGKVQKADLTNANVIFNGRLYTGAKDDAHLKPAIGTVRLISDNNEYKYVIVESFTNHVADTTNPEDNIVYFKDGTPAMTIDLSDNSVVTLFTDAEGMPMAVTDIAAWDILSIAKSEDNKVHRIYSSQTVIEGKITEKSEDTVVIGDAFYPIAPSLFGVLSVGMTAGYCLDFTGAVTAVNETYQSGGEYGWLVSTETTKGLDGKPRFKIFTQNSEMKVLDTTERVQLNDVSTACESLLLPSLYRGTELWSGEKEGVLVDADGNTVPQLIKYETNEEGLIISIDTAKNQSNPNLDYVEKYDNNFSMDWYWKTPKDGGGPVEFNGTMPGNTEKKIVSKVENGNGIFFTHVLTDSNTKFFIIPSDPTRDAGYQIRKLSEFDLDQARASECVSFYDINDNNHCGAMVMHTYLVGSGDSEMYPDQSVGLGMITGSSITLSEDGEVQNTLKMYTSSGKEVSVSVAEDMEALYANTTSDITLDPYWYTKEGDVKKNLSAEERAKYTARYNASEKKALPMYIAVSDLVPGDVIQYEADDDGKLSVANVVFRKDYAVHMEMYQRATTAQVMATTKFLNYVGGGKVKINGLVKKVTEGGIIIDTHPVNTNGVLQEGITFERMLKSAGKYVLWDNEREEWRAITMADVRQGDSVFAYWANLSQKIVTVYRGEKR